MNCSKEKKEEEEKIIIKYKDGEIHLGPPCPPLPEFTFNLEKEKQNDCSST